MPHDPFIRPAFSTTCNDKGICVLIVIYDKRIKQLIIKKIS